MAEQDIIEEQIELPVGVGQKLCAARMARGLSLAQVSAETRIPERHLRLIDQGDFGNLPGRTYAIGFSKTYARLLGQDEDEIGQQVRAELDALGEYAGGQAPANFEPGDPARVPSSLLAWVSAIAALLLVVGALSFWGGVFTPAATIGPVAEVVDGKAPKTPVQAAQQAAAPAASDASGQVEFTALEEGIWVKFYDQNGQQLMQKQMAAGERYIVPADAQGPQLWTGRPDALGITIGGKAVTKLAESHMVIKDVPVTAAALLERQQTAPGPGSPTG